MLAPFPLIPALNLSDLRSVATALDNLGLGGSVGEIYTGATTINFATRREHSGTITGNVVFTFTAPTTPGKVTIQMTDTAGGHTRAWPGSVSWVNGRQPLTMTAGETQEVELFWNGTGYIGGTWRAVKDTITVTRTSANVDADIATSTIEMHVDDSVDQPALILDIKDQADSVFHVRIPGVLFAEFPATGGTFSPDEGSPSFLYCSSGSGNTNVRLPSSSTLALGRQFLIANGTSAILTIQSNALNTISTLPQGAACIATCVNLGIDTAAAWVVTYFVPSGGTAGQVLKSGGSTNAGVYADDIGVIVASFDGLGSAPAVGSKGYVNCPFAGTIVAATLVSDATGSIVIDVWKLAFSTTNLPTVANTITAAAKPTLSSAKGSQNTTLTGWTVAVAAGDTFGFNVDSASGLMKATLTLKIRKS